MLVAGDIDYEKNTVISLRVKARDKEGQVAYGQFTVQVENKVEGPGMTYQVLPQYQCPGTDYCSI